METDLLQMDKGSEKVLQRIKNSTKHLNTNVAKPQ